MSPFARLVACAAVVALLPAPRPFAAGNTEILWDHYGVPHIFAPDRESMFHAHGWAQMQNQANLLLRLYGESRGRILGTGQSRARSLGAAQRRSRARESVVRRARSSVQEISRRIRRGHQRLCEGASRRDRSRISRRPAGFGRRCGRTPDARRALRLHGFARPHEH